MKKRFILAGSLMIACLLSTNVSAEVWTDGWWNPAESGWGVNIISQHNTLFAMFFVYGPSGDAKWYSGAASLTGQTNEFGYHPFSGDLYESRGPFFGSPFDPNLVQRRKVGTFTFSPSSSTTATVTYDVDGVTSTRQVERFTFLHIPLGGAYLATAVITEDECLLMADPGTAVIVGEVEFTETGNPGTTGSITVTFIVDGERCEETGTYHQYGSTYSIDVAGTCLTDSPEQVKFFDVKYSDEGVTGKLTVEQNSCLVKMTFSAVRW